MGGREEIKPQLIGEPVGMPDGSAMCVWREEDRIIVNFNQLGEMARGGETSVYMLEEVTLLGEGSFDRGVVRIALANYREYKESIDGSRENMARPLQGGIMLLQQRQGE
jgi:hypothetical protein